MAVLLFRPYGRPIASLNQAAERWRGGAQCARPLAILATVYTSLALCQTAPILPLSQLEELHLLDGLMLQVRSGGGIWEGVLRG